MVCLDTSFLIDLIREKKSGKSGPAGKKMRELVDRNEIPKTTVITLFELYVGPYCVRDTASELEKVREVVEEMEVLYLTENTARLFGKIVADLYDIGKPIGVMDAFIAALTLWHGETLITRDLSDFENIRGVNAESY